MGAGPSIASVQTPHRAQCSVSSPNFGTTRTSRPENIIYLVSRVLEVDGEMLNEAKNMILTEYRILPHRALWQPGVAHAPANDGHRPRPSPREAGYVKWWWWWELYCEYCAVCANTQQLSITRTLAINLDRLCTIVHNAPTFLPLHLLLAAGAGSPSARQKLVSGTWTLIIHSHWNFKMWTLTSFWTFVTPVTSNTRWWSGVAD